ncbi:MAG: NAD(P)/FAD-dependent oxidoreductase [Nitrospirae bacterium]|nr:NAD(P)/FAD-dependent oxidoreductase [Magnetococcales bacterium]
MNTPDTSRQVIIVGAGPSGAMAAWKLAQAGCDVVILDAKTFPRPKPCAGWITRTALHSMELNETTYPHLLVPITRVAIGLEEGLHITAWPRPVSYGILRHELDDFLLQRAKAAGAKVYLGQRVDRVEFLKDAVSLSVGTSRIQGELVIGAGGATCPVARASQGKDLWKQRTMVCSQMSETRIGMERLQGSGLDTGLPVLFPEPECDGYAWYFTKGDFLNIGVGALKTGPGIPFRRHRFLERLRRDGILPPSWTLAPFTGHSYAVWRGLRHDLTGRHHLLVGDAAGLARDFSGEGIGMAVQSGSLAASYGIAKLAGHNNLTNYTQEIARIHGTGLLSKIGTMMEKIPLSLRRPLINGFCRAPWLRRRVIMEGIFLAGCDTP